MAHRFAMNATGSLTPFEAIAYAEVFGRLAAASGKVGDQLMLAAILLVRSAHVAEIGEAERAWRLIEYAESLCVDLSDLTLCDGVEFLVGILTDGADRGEDKASILIERIMAALSAADADRLRCTVNSALAELGAREALAVGAASE
jgi:hypothetical protein